MRNFGFLLLYSLSMMGFDSFAQSTAKTRDFSVTLSPVELGGLIPFKNGAENSLPGPIHAFIHKKKPNVHTNVLRLGLLYKSKYGIEAFYNFSMGLEYRDSGIENYLTQSYPAYEKPKTSPASYPNYSASWKGWQAAVFYRIRLKQHLYLEPKFQVGFETYRQGDAAYYLKEKGSNQFIEYFINVESPKKLTPSFHYILNTSWLLNPNSQNIKFELGLKAEYLMMNVNLDYTITQSPYGMPDQIEQHHVWQPVSGLILALYMKMRY